ncbi:hypothetical protein G9O61_00g008120 [Vairimorpha ceranae]|nr:hypothetical protein G9O61_00g008120 [Vairimorpha ceranae]
MTSRLIIVPVLLFNILFVTATTNETSEIPIQATEESEQVKELESIDDQAFVTAEGIGANFDVKDESNNISTFEKPEDNPADGKPNENPADEKPNENPESGKPNENPADEKPNENPADEKPKESSR